MTNKTIIIPENVYDLYDDVEKLFRQNHPELNEVYLSKRKLTYEIIKYYLQNTEYEIKK